MRSEIKMLRSPCKIQMRFVLATHVHTYTGEHVLYARTCQNTDKGSPTLTRNTTLVLFSHDISPVDLQHD